MQKSVSWWSTSRINILTIYYKLGQGVITNSGSFVLLQIGASVIKNWGSLIITNQDEFCYKSGQLLQIRANVITNWGSYHKLGQISLQIRAAITNWGIKNTWLSKRFYKKVSTYNRHILYVLNKLASIAMMLGGALANALAFTRTSYFFSSLSKDSIDKERKRHYLAIEKLQKAQIEW